MFMFVFVGTILDSQPYWHH